MLDCRSSPPAAAVLNEQVLDLRRAVRALRRRWRVVLALFAIGVGVGVVVTLKTPRVYIATTDVLLPPSPVDSKGLALRDIETELHIARSSDVVGQAAAALQPPVRAAVLRPRIQVRPLSTDIIEVVAAADSGRNAAQQADAVAEAYVALSSGTSSTQNDSVLARLKKQIEDMSQEIDRLNGSVAGVEAALRGQDPASAEGVRLTGERDALRNRQAGIVAQVSTLETQVSDAQQAAAAKQGIRVLERASRPKHPARPRPLWNVGWSGLVGLAAGGVVGLVIDVKQRRMRSRDQMARAAGAPVVASLTLPRRGSARACRVLVNSWVPTAIEALTIRRAFLGLGVDENDGPTNVVVITLPGDQSGPLVAFQLAAFAADTGTPTAFRIATRHPSTAQLRFACGARADESSQIRRNLFFLEADPASEANDLGGVQLTITLVVRSDDLVLPTSGWPTISVIAAASGVATAEQLAAAAVAAIDAGHPVRGVLVANPESNDSTTGLGGLPIWARRDGVRRVLGSGEKREVRRQVHLP